MVSLHEVQLANKALITSRDLVCVVSGGTAGIGKAALQQLASISGSEPEAKSLRVYIIARNLGVAEILVGDLKTLCPRGEFISIQATDLSLLKDVDKACDQILKLENSRSRKIDLVLMSQGYLDPFSGRTDTSEGIESKMSLHFYSRMRLVHRLLPLLTARAVNDAPAQIISVYAAGMEPQGRIFPDDLSLRQPGHYSFANSRTTVVHMKTMFFEHLARDHAGKLSFVHQFPGLVLTETAPQLYKPPYPLWFRLAARIMVPLAKLTIAVPVIECGQRTLFLATEQFRAYSDQVDTASTTGQGGVYSCKANGNTNDVSQAYMALRGEGFYEKVWNHIMGVFEAVNRNVVYTQ